MTKYRDDLTELYDSEIGSVVGSGLDRLERPVSQSEIIDAVAFYNDNKEEIDKKAIGDRREAIAEFIRLKKGL